MNLQYFSDQDFYFSIKKFFKDLNIPVHYMTAQPALAKDIISNTFKPQNPAHQLIDDVYFLGMVDDRAFNNQPSVIDDKQLKKEDYDGLLVFGITLDRQDGKLPTRGQMAEVTRAFNREFHYTPVVIVFKYAMFGTQNTAKPSIRGLFSHATMENRLGCLGLDGVPEI